MNPSINGLPWWAWSGTSRPPIVPRASLPPFPPSPTGRYSIDYLRPMPPPSKLYHRGNFGTWVTGAPPVEGGYNATQPWAPYGTDYMMSIDIFKYPQEYITEAFVRNLQDGYTHFQFTPRPMLAAGWSVDQVAGLLQQWRSLGGFADVWLMGKGDYPDCRDQTADYWAPRVDPWLDALISNGVIDTACLMWECNLFNIPGQPIQTIIDYFADKLNQHDIPTMLHFGTEMTWWGADDASHTPNRFDWWRRQRGLLRGIHYQGDTHNWAMNDLQGRMADTTVPFRDGRMGDSGFGHPFLFCAAEVSLEAMFYQQPLLAGMWSTNGANGYAPEAAGDSVGYLSLCGAEGADSFYNGGRMPDGTAI